MGTLLSRLVGVLDRLSTAPGILALFVVVNLVSLAVSLVQTHTNVVAMEAQTATAVSLVATNRAGDLDERLRHAVSLARSFERIPAFWDGTDEDRDVLLRALAVPDERVNALVFATPDLEQHGASNNDGQPRFSVFGRSYAREAVATGAVTVTAEPLQALTTGEVVLPVAVPTRDARDPARWGLIIVGLRADRLSTVLNGSLAVDGASSVLVDVRSRQMLLDGRSGAFTITEDVAADWAAQVSGSGGSSGTFLTQGSTTLVVWHRLADAPWTVFIAVPFTTVLAPIYASAGTAALAHLLIALAMGFLMVLLWRRTAGRVGRLADAARCWADGDLTYRSGLAGADDIGLLGVALDQMAATQEQTAVALREQHEQQSRELQRREAILRSARRVASEGQRDDLLQALLSEAVQTVGADDGGITRWDEHQGRLLALRRFLPSLDDGQVLPVESTSHRAATSRAPVFVHAYQETIGQFTTPGQRGARAALAVPIIHDGNLLGTLSVSTRNVGHRFTQEDADQLEILATSVAGSLVRLEASEALSRHVERLDTLTQLSTLISRSLDMDEVLHAIANAASTLMDVPIVQLWVADDQQRVVHLRGTSERARSIPFRVDVLAFGEGAAGRVAASGEPLTLSDLEHDRRFGGLNFWADFGVRYYYALPVLSDGRVVAVLSLFRSEPFDFDERDMALLNSFIAQAAVALENARLYAAAAEARDAAESASRVKADFLATMSHEIRTPLNGILGLSELTLAMDLEDEQRQNLEMIARSGDALLRIVNDILDLSKIEAGKLAIEATPLTVRDAILDAIGLHSVQAEQKGLVLEHDIAADVPKQVIGDPSRLRQILFNLVGNAVKFTDAGRVTVQVTVADRCDDGALLRVEVRDSGIGIDEATISTLFQPFTQADRSTTRRFGGTGLGLTICRRLVEHMGGEIGVESEPGRGSLFWFTVRVGLALNDTPERDVPLVAPVAPTVVEHPGAPVLVVDDSPINRLVTVRMLKHLGYTAVSVESGEQALAAIAEQAFAIVLTDCYMPEMDGFTLVQELRARGHTLPVLAMTADVLDATRERCLAAGMNACLTKPVRTDLLQQALSVWLARPPEFAAPG